MAYMLSGEVDWAEGAEVGVGQVITDTKIYTPGKVTFTRESDGETVETYTDTLRKNSKFEAELPSGTWTLKLTKKGYLTYTITGIEVESSELVLGDPTNNTTAKAIVPKIGEAKGRGKIVDIYSAGVVANGLRAGVDPMIKLRGDVDDDKEVSATSDMAFVRNNYLKLETIQTYSAFCTE